MVQPFWETDWEFIKNLNTELQFDPEIPTPRYIPKRNKNTRPHKNLDIGSHIIQQQPKCPFGE